MADLGLPARLIELAEFSPVEDILLAILRADIPEVPTLSLVPDDPPRRFITTRRVPGFGQWPGDERFVDKARFGVNTFTADPDGDEEGAVLQEAIRVVLRNAWRAHRVLPGLGSVKRIKLVQEPVRRPDFATATGPVQYADLPTGTWRYESQYTIEVRKPR